MDTVNFDDLNPTTAVTACLTLALMYVGSLYVWTSNLPRDDPLTIKERFRRVLFTSIISVIFAHYISSDVPSKNNAYVYEWLGIRYRGILAASILPLLLFMTLFLGPLYHMILEDGFRNYHPRMWKFYLADLRYWRNYIVAPFSEELVFRGCMLPILVPGFGAQISTILAPSFFGIAHAHHAWEKYFKNNYPLNSVILSTVFQAFYTTIFGGLSSWLFLRTGHLTSVVICHTFCNMMGFPDFEGVFYHERRISISLAYVVGLVLFIWLANPITEPSIYGNILYAE